MTESSAVWRLNRLLGGLTSRRNHDEDQDAPNSNAQEAQSYIAAGFVITWRGGWSI